MKVCVLVWSKYPTDARVRKYSEALVERGDDVDVICLSSEDSEKIPHKYSLKGVSVYEVDKRFQEKRPVDYLISVLKFFFISSYYFSKLYIKNRYDVIHVHSVPDFEVFAAFLSKLLGARIILDIHDPVPDFFVAKFGNKKNKLFIKYLIWMERLSSRFSDHVITVTNYWSDVIRERSFIPDRKISVILNLPDTRIFNVKQSSKKIKSKKNFTLIYPGTLNKHCGIDIAIKAVELLKDEIPSMRFLIYGKGSEYNRLKSMTKDRNLENIVFFYKHVSWDMIPKIIHASDVGIALLSGHGEYSQQALSVKLFEFLAMGLPVVTTETEAIKHHLDDDIVMLSKQNDPKDVARCIKELYLDSNKRHELKRKGIEYIKRNNWELEKNKYYRIIDKLL